MAYIVANYYIGACMRYDGSGNTDKAEISLFMDKGNGIKYVIDTINNSYDEDEEELPTIEEITKIKKKLNKWGICNFRDTYMFTIEFAEIK